jgi:thymidylate kinase
MDCNLICIVGPDGTGKSTQAAHLLDTLRKEGVNCEYKWMRFNHFLSLPVLLVARVLGLSEVVTLSDGKKVGYHYYWRSNLISRIYPFAMYLDTSLNYIFRVYLPIRLLKKTIICDRFIYDTIVDVMISTGRSDPDNWIFSRLFAGIIPRRCIGILLTADEDTLRQRRNDVMLDKYLKDKIELYDKIGPKYGLVRVDASLPVPEVSRIIQKAIFR